MENLCEFPDDDGRFICRRQATYRVYVSGRAMARVVGEYTIEVLRLECVNHAGAEIMRNASTYVEPMVTT